MDQTERRRKAVDVAYRLATAATGHSEAELRHMAVECFASMLVHAMDRPDCAVYTGIQLGEKGLWIGVNLPPESIGENLAGSSAVTGRRPVARTDACDSNKVSERTESKLERKD